MKTKFIRALTLMLALLMLSVAFASCIKKAEAPDDSETVSESGSSDVEADIYEGLRDLDYGGRRFIVMTYDSSVYWNPYFQEVDGGALVLNSAVTKRNAEVKSLLNVDLSTYLVDKDDLVNQVYNTTAGGTVTYDLIAFYATNKLASLMVSDILYNVKKIDKMNTEAEWYNQNANQNFTLKSKQYFFVSEYTLPIQQRFAILANNDMIEEYSALDNISDFEGDSIYELVSAGQWTFENMKLMIKGVNPDGSHSDPSGTYGFATGFNQVSRFLNNWGEDIVSLDEYGRFQFKLHGGTLDAKVTALTELVNNNNDVYAEPRLGGGNAYYDIFKDGRAMFSAYSSDPWDLLESGYQDKSFAYLPYPKYNSDQENYITVTHGGLMAFSSHTPDIEFSGAVVEALSAASMKYVRDAYIKNYFETKIIQDPEGIDMYNIMLDTAYYDIARYVDPSQGNKGEALCQYLLYFTYVIDGNVSLDGRYESHGSMITEAYANLYSKLPQE